MHHLLSDPWHIKLSEARSTLSVLDGSGLLHVPPACSDHLPLAIQGHLVRSAEKRAFFLLCCAAQSLPAVSSFEKQSWKEGGRMAEQRQPKLIGLGWFLTIFP